MRDTLRVSVPCPGQAEKGLDHQEEALTRGHFHAHAGISVGRIPPIMPDVRLDGGGLSLAQNARLSATLNGQLTINNGEAFDNPGMAVFAGDSGSDARD